MFKSLCYSSYYDMKKNNILPFLTLLLLITIPLLPSDVCSSSFETTSTLGGLLGVEPAPDLLSNVIDVDKIVNWLVARLNPQLEKKEIRTSKARLHYCLSIEEAFWAIATLKLLNARPLRTYEIISIVQCYQKMDGGFNFGDDWSFSGADQANMSSFLVDTYYAVIILDMLGARPAEVEKCISYIRSLQQGDGGFFPQPDPSWWDGLQNTRMAVLALKTLGSTLVDSNKCREYIRYFQEEPGLPWYVSGRAGMFGNRWKDAVFAEIEDTYNAILALKALGCNLTHADECATSLRSLQLDDGGIYDSSKSGLEDTHYCVAALWALQSKPADSKACARYILEWFPRDFEDLPPSSSDIWWTLRTFYHLTFGLTVLANAEPNVFVGPPFPRDALTLFISLATVSVITVAIVGYLRNRRRQSLHKS